MLLENMRCKDETERRKQVDECFKCGKAGHIARNCWKSTDNFDQRENDSKQEVKSAEPAPRLTCYSCGELGHYKSNCPKQKSKPNKTVRRIGSPEQRSSCQDKWMVCVAN